MWCILLFYYLHLYILDHYIVSSFGYLMIYNHHEGIKVRVSFVSLNKFGRQICPVLWTDFGMFTNDVPFLSAVVKLTSADVTLDTAGGDLGINRLENGYCKSNP